MSGEELKPTHPNTDQGVTAEDIVTRLRKQADRIGLLLTDPPQETVDGALMREAADEISSLKQRLESAEGLLKALCDYNPDDPWHKYASARTFLQEQEKQNG